MNKITLLELLAAVQSGTLTPAAATERLATLPYEDLGHARIDHHRTLRPGPPNTTPQPSPPCPPPEPTPSPPTPTPPLPQWSSPRSPQPSTPPKPEPSLF